MNGNQKTQAPITGPVRATLIEVAPRDGFQFELQVVPTDLKVEIVSALVEAGLTRIQVASFVHPDKVPQMADAEELFRRLPQKDSVLYSALVLNHRGLERALAVGVKSLEISISASDTHGRKNAGMGLEAGLAEAAAMIRSARGARTRIRAGVQCAFGCVYEGRISEDLVLSICERFLSQGIDHLALSDTTGMAAPGQVRSLLSRVLPLAGNVPVVMHLHDTRGLGLVNLAAALDCGVTRFDTAAGGMGGCPFVAGAAGNIATEDAAYLLSRLGVETGIDIAKVAVVTERLEDFFGRRFPVKNRRQALAGAEKLDIKRA